MWFFELWNEPATCFMEHHFFLGSMIAKQTMVIEIWIFVRHFLKNEIFKSVTLGKTMAKIHSLKQLSRISENLLTTMSLILSFLLLF